MNVRFKYEDLNGKDLTQNIIVSGKVLENENDVITQRFDNIAYGYILVTVGADGETFKNTWMTGDENFQIGIPITSMYPIIEK